MSVDDRFYTVWGIRGSFPEFGDFYHSEENETAREKGLQMPFLLSQGKDTWVFGIPLFDSGWSRWNWKGGDWFKEVPFPDLNQMELEYKAKFREKLPQFSSLMEFPFKLFTIHVCG